MMCSVAYATEARAVSPCNYASCSISAHQSFARPCANTQHRAKHYERLESVCSTKLQKYSAGTKKVHGIRVRGNRAAAASRVRMQMSSADTLDRRVEKIMQILSRDLPRQYTEDIDWSIYSNNVVFVDPSSRFEGKILYRCMIGTLRLLSTTIFEGSSAEFILYSIEEVDAFAGTVAPFSAREVGVKVAPVRAVRTVWATKARSRWATDLFISGDDIFRIDCDGFIVTHESAWNEAPKAIWEQLRG